MTSPPRVDLSIIGTGGQDDAWWSRELPEFGRSAVEQYEEIRDRSPQVGGAFLAIESLLRRVQWTCTPAERPSGPRGAWTEARARYWAGFLDGCLDDMSHTWPGFIADVLSMLQHGWAFFEIVYKYRRGPDQQDARYRSRYDDGCVGWRKLALRPQNTLSRWQYDGDGGIQGMWQLTSRGEVFIPIGRAIHFRTSESGNNPEGRSLLKNARRSYLFAKRLEEFEAIGVERDLTGVPHLEVPVELLSPTASLEEKATLVAMVEQAKALRRDEASIIVTPSSQYVTSVYDEKAGMNKPIQLPTGFKFSLLGTNGTRTYDTSAIINRYKTDIAVSLLASFLMLGMDGKGGAFALSSDLTDLFELSVAGVLDGIASTVNRFPIARLMQLNAVPPELWPTLTHGGVSNAALNAMLDMLNKLLTSGGVTHDENLEARLRELLHMPEQAQPSQADPSARTTGDASAAAAALALDLRFT